MLIDKKLYSGKYNEICPAGFLDTEAKLICQTIAQSLFALWLLITKCVGGANSKELRFSGLIRPHFSLFDSEKNHNRKYELTV